MKQYYEVYENAIISHPFTGKRVSGNKKILTTKSRTKALDLYNKNTTTRWVEEITDEYGVETTDVITC